MLTPGDKIRFVSDTKGEVLTIKSVSPWIDADDNYMIETEEYAPGWTWASGVIIVQKMARISAEDQLDFLGM